MKILHTLDSFDRGGAETLALDVCRNAEKFGLEMTFAATGAGVLFDEFKNSGVDFVYHERKFPLDLSLVRHLRKIIKEKEIRIVHGHQPVEILHLYLATIGLKNVKRVQSHHGYISGAKNRLAAKYLSPLVDANISVGRGFFSWVREEIGIDTSKNFYLISNGVDEKRLAPSGENSIKEELGLKKDDFLLGMIASFPSVPRKDQITVCRALPKVFENFENANFIFVGDVAEGGEEKFNECVDFCNKNGIGEKVFFLGGRKDIPDILNSLDVFVLSSLVEGLPIAIIEAMLTKVPIIVSDIEPLVEATKNGKYAEIFQTKNHEELAEKILKLLNDRDLRENLAGDAYKFAKKNFSIEAHLRNLRRLYEYLLNKNGE